MPNIKSAIKSLRQDKKKHERNKTVASELRTATKKTCLLISDKKKPEAEIALRALESKLDKAAKRNIIKKGNVSRRISRLRSQLAKI
ncbi:MAG: 30S ribosomal protein S20 [Candidatus Omnitrophota bacterium]